MSGVMRCWDVGGVGVRSCANPGPPFIHIYIYIYIYILFNLIIYIYIYILRISWRSNFGQVLECRFGYVVGWKVYSCRGLSSLSVYTNIVILYL